MNGPAKFNNKYRIASCRLTWWDYGWNGSYFVTICTKNREHFFGEITGRKMELSEIGLIAKNYWNQIPQHFQFVKLDAFIVMPNHVHGIIIIVKSTNGDDGAIIETPKLGVSMNKTIVNQTILGKTKPGKNNTELGRISKFMKNPSF